LLSNCCLASRPLRDVRDRLEHLGHTLTKWIKCLDPLFCPSDPVAQTTIADNDLAVGISLLKFRYERKQSVPFLPVCCKLAKLVPAFLLYFPETLGLVASGFFLSITLLAFFVLPLLLLKDRSRCYDSADDLR